MDNYVGKILDGRYEIQDIIGVGGMAVVYKAYDNIDDRIVAVKILKDEFLANEEFRRRFKNESKAIAVLSHPNIVKVYDVSYGDRLQYIVMEYVEGITLKEYILQQKKLSWKEAVHFITQVLRALQHAHDKGIVHRDIKPQNILLLQNGNIRVTDFGIARFSRSDTRTMTDSAIGSVHYISPEQARGDKTDDKADLYSVGVVLYEMLTGQVPFQSDSSVSVAIMQLQSEPKLPSELNPNIPQGLEQITMRAMQKNSRDRYQSAAEMLLDLEEFKRNPAVRFEYNFFVDKDPTKYVSAVDKIKSTPPKKDIPTPITDEEEENEVQYRRVVPVITGVVVGAVVLFAFVMVILYSLGKIGKPDEVIVVEDFFGKNYYTEIENNDKYKDYKFSTETEQSDLRAPGTVLKQSPESGKKIKKGDVVRLTIVEGTAKVKIPEVFGLTQDEAESKLKKNGLINITVKYEDSNEVDAGCVVKTIPAIGTEVEVSASIVVYITKVIVPDILDWKQQEAEQQLILKGLKIGKIEQANSDKEAGIVISQSPQKDARVEKGTPIDIVVSNGVRDKSSTNITITLPDLVGNSGSIVDGEIKLYIEYSVVKTFTEQLNGRSYTIPIEGSGQNKFIQVTIDGTLVYSCNMDFTVSPAAVTNEKTFQYKKGFVPNVVGMTEMAARAKLTEEGFTRVYVQEVEVDDISDIGIVIEQSEKTTVILKTTSITLKVGVAKKEQSTIPDTDANGPVG